jgi:preprotein translocase subunit SecD
MTLPTADAAGKDNRGLPPVAALVALLVVGGLLLVFTIRATDEDQATTAIPAKPLRILAVLTQDDGPCTITAPDTFETADPRTCLTVDLDVGVTMKELRQVTPEHSGQSTGWQVTIELEAEDAQAFSDLTALVASNPPPGNIVAMIVGDAVVTAVQVAEPIAPGPVLVSGFPTREEAVSVAEQLGYRG